MKNYTLLFTAIGLLTLNSCINENLDNHILDQDNAFRIVTSNFVNEQDAVKEVEALLKLIDVPTRIGGKRQITNCIKIGGFGATRTEDAEESPLYYIINFENDEGFAVASGDNRTTPIFCITEQGHLDNLDFINSPEDADIPGMAIMFSEYDTDYRLSVGLPINTYNGIITPGETGYPATAIKVNSIINDTNANITTEYTPWLTTGAYGRIIAARWGQRTPFNNRMRKNSSGNKQLAGCCPIALAQIMFFWGQPNGLMKYTKEPLDWTIIRRHTIENATNTTPCTQADSHNMIANLIYEMHNAKNLNPIYFGENGTAALISNIPRTLKNFGYGNYGSTVSYNASRVSSALNAGRPVIVCGYAKKILGIVPMAEGHFWVIDQELAQVRIQKVYSNGILQTTSSENRRLVHVNWGWSGSCNGYYYPSRFDSNNGQVFTRTGDSGYYRYNMDMNTDISWTKI